MGNDRRVTVNAIGNELDHDSVIFKELNNGPRNPVVNRVHGIKQVRHVGRTGIDRLAGHLIVGVRVSHRGNCAARYEVRHGF